MTTRTITAIFDTEADARRAQEQLFTVGLDDEDVHIISQQLSRSEISGDENGAADKGMWESIKDFFVGEEDRDTYAEGVRRGGYLLTALVDDDLSDEAMSQLERSNAIDLDQRTAQWRSEGWSGTPASSTDFAATGSTAQSAAASERDDVTDASVRNEPMSSGEEAIPIIKERLRVGKREVDRGGVRVRSYVVEEPVREDVTLREERVEVERRPVSERGADTSFQERTIEVAERGEEAVVTKDAVVTEEVVVRKMADERVESIDDTVRRTEVEIDDTRRDSADKSSSGQAAGNSRKRAR
jgi:uncharacterized protein (TIGR02271 family)